MIYYLCCVLLDYQRAIYLLMLSKILWVTADPLARLINLTHTCKLSGPWSYSLVGSRICKESCSSLAPESNSSHWWFLIFSRDGICRCVASIWTVAFWARNPVAPAISSSEMRCSSCEPGQLSTVAALSGSSLGCTCSPKGLAMSPASGCIFSQSGT